MSRQPGLFGAPAPPPLADRSRPGRLSEVVGQDHLLAKTAPLGRMIARQRLTSLILWGPPGCGKTTIARLLADVDGSVFRSLSAVFSGVADLRKIFAAAVRDRAAGRGTVLFVDEIHRFNRAQQDGFLPFVEDGTITLVGATTENPSFELNAALLSRCQVLVLRPLDRVALDSLLRRAEAMLDRTLPLTAGARDALLAMADGDGRFLLNVAEDLFALPAGGACLSPGDLVALVQRRAPIHDKSGESHYNLVSALHKSVRGSDPDAALYWLARMLSGGEDPRFVARRLTRMAVEDIGLADPDALARSLAAWEAWERLGSPEGELALAQCAVSLAVAPKSNRVCKAFGAAMQAARESGSTMPPAHILNAPTGLLRDLGYGRGYRYDHDEPDGFSGQNFFPDGMERPQFYRPSQAGREARIAARLESLAQRRRDIAAGDTASGAGVAGGGRRTGD